jgi:WD40 repeat protein
MTDGATGLVQPQKTADDESVFDAFISYSHSADSRLASSLQSGLHRFAKPWYRMRALRSFRDETNLMANPGLWSEIRKALLSSRYFILLASPQAAVSPWVDSEIEEWYEHKPRKNLLLVLTDGDLAWNGAENDFDWGRSSAVSKKLSKKFAEVPLWVDLRGVRRDEDLSLKNPKFADAVATLAAAIRGVSKDTLIGEDVRLQRRARSLARAAIATLTVLTAIASSTAYYAIVQKTVAENRLEQALVAQSHYLARAAEEYARAGDSETALGVILNALPSRTNQRPRVDEAVGVLQEILASDRQLEILVGHRNMLTYATFSSDGKRVFTVAEDRTARFWDTNTGIQLDEFRSAGEREKIAAISSDGKLILTTNDKGIGRLWDAAIKSPLLARFVHSRIINSAAFSHDNQHIITASADGTAVIWSVSGERLLTIRSDGSAFRSATLSPDEKYVVTTSDRSNMVLLWSLSKPARLIQSLRCHKDDALYADFSPDSKLIVTTSRDATACVWNIARLAIPLAVLKGHGEWVNAASFSPDGRRIVTASRDATVRVWDVATGGQITQLNGHSDSVTSVKFSPDGNFIVSASADRTARLWFLPAVQQTILEGHNSAVMTVAFTDSGDKVVTGSVDRSAIVWDALTGKSLWPIRGEYQVNDAEFSHDGKKIVLAMDRGIVQVTHVLGDPISLFRHSDNAETAAFLAGDQEILSSSRDGNAVIWNINSCSIGTCRASRYLSGHQGAVADATLSADERFVATSSVDHTVRIWNRRQGAPLSTILAHPNAVYSVRFSPDGTHIVTGSLDHTAAIWDWRHSRRLTILRGHTAGVNAVRYSIDGALIATASDDGTIMLWSAATGEQEATLFGHTGPVISINFSPDRIHLASASKDGTARIWRLPLQTVARSTPILGNVGLANTISWAWAAQYESLPQDLRKSLGLALAYPKPKDYMQAPPLFGAKGQQYESMAIAQSNETSRNRLLLSAMRYYALACDEAELLQWNSVRFRDWRYRRGSLARYFAREGRAADVARIMLRLAPIQ